MIPYEALFHMEPRTVLNLEFQAATPGTLTDRIIKDSELISRLMTDNLKKAQATQKHYFDRNKPAQNSFSSRRYGPENPYS